MPAKNSIGAFHGRHPLIRQDLWKRYMKETGQKIDYEEFKKIIAESMEEIKKWVLREPIGFQMSPKLGNIAINRFAMYKTFRAYTKTPLGSVINHNLHTGGYIFTIRWYHSEASHKSRQPYWFFKACRAFNRSLAVVLKGSERPNFNSYMQDHFINKVK